MSSVSPSQVPSLVTQMGYAPMLRAYADEPAVRQQVFAMVPVEGWEEGVDVMDVTGPVVPGEIKRGEASPHRTINETYRRVGLVRKLAESITLQEEFLRNPNASALLGAKIGGWMAQMGKGFQIAKETYAAKFLNRGSISAGDILVFDGSHPGHADPYPKFIYDGKPFFAASGAGHPNFFTSSTYVNQDANALSSTNLESARVLMASTNAFNESDERIRIDPNVLVVPPDLSRTARVLVNTTLLPGTAQNDINTLQGQYAVIEWRYLTDTDGWFLGVRGQGVKIFDSGDPVINISEPDKATGDITIRLISYHGGYVEDWRYWSAHATSTS